MRVVRRRWTDLCPNCKTADVVAEFENVPAAVEASAAVEELRREASAIVLKCQTCGFTSRIVRVRESKSEFGEVRTFPRYLRANHDLPPSTKWIVGEVDRSIADTRARGYELVSVWTLENDVFGSFRRGR